MGLTGLEALGIAMEGLAGAFYQRCEACYTQAGSGADAGRGRANHLKLVRMRGHGLKRGLIGFRGLHGGQKKLRQVVADKELSVTKREKTKMG